MLCNLQSKLSSVHMIRKNTFTIKPELMKTIRINFLNETLQLLMLCDLLLLSFIKTRKSHEWRSWRRATGCSGAQVEPRKTAHNTGGKKRAIKSQGRNIMRTLLSLHHAGHPYEPQGGWKERNLIQVLWLF